MPEVRERLASMGMDATEQISPEKFGALIRSELARWSSVVRQAGMRAD